MMAEARIHPDPDALVRRELGQLFEVERALRHGPLASVYVARDTETGAVVALKTIPRLPSLEAGSAERFRRQAVLAARLYHPHVVRLRRHGVSPSFLWYSMDLCPGGALSTVEAMPVLACVRAVQQIASALDYAHHHDTPHGDLRPTNVLLDERGWLRVADFGMLRALGGVAALDKTTSRPGDLDYVAPEQLVPGGAPGPAADQYALAVLTYECLAGSPVFGAATAEDLVARRRAGPPPDLAAVRQDVPSNLAGAVRRAMSEAPEERFANVAEFSASLIRPAIPVVLWPADGTAEDDDEVPRPVSHSRARRRRQIGAVLAVLAVAAGGVWFALSPSSRSSPPPAVAEREVVSAPEVPRLDSQVSQVVVVPTPAPAPPAAPPAAPPPLPPARVVVNSIPWADLYVDGRLVGNTPVVDLRLAAGRHRLRLVRPGFKPHEEVVNVAPGQTLRITGIVLQPEPAP